MKIKTIKEIIFSEIHLYREHGLEINPTEVADKVIPQIKQLIKDQMPRMHKSPDNYVSLEKWTECEHRKQDILADNCIHCDMDWAIGRMRLLEKYIDNLGKIIEELK